MIHIKLFRSNPLSLRKSGKWFLALSWCVGLLLGMSAARDSGATLVSMMRSAVAAPVSIVGLFSAAVLPFLLSAYAISISEPWLLLIISAFKAFGFSFCGYAVSLAFGQSGWLVRFLFLFSDCCLVPLLYLYWFRYISGERSFSRWELFACVAVAVAVGSIDYCLVSPFLATLI